MSCVCARCLGIKRSFMFAGENVSALSPLYAYRSLHFHVFLNFIWINCGKWNSYMDCANICIQTFTYQAARFQCMHAYVCNISSEWLYENSYCWDHLVWRAVLHILVLSSTFNIHFICLHNVPILFSITSPFLAHTFKTNSWNLFCTLVYVCAYDRVCVAVSYILEKSLHLILMASK